MYLYSCGNSDSGNLFILILIIMQENEEQLTMIMNE